MCWFGYSTSMLLCLYKAPTCSDLLFHKKWVNLLCLGSVWLAVGLDGLPGMGDVLDDLPLSSPIHHGLHTGVTVSSRDIFQKLLLPQGFIRGFFIFTFPCKAMIARPLVWDAIFTSKKLNQTEGTFKSLFALVSHWQVVGLQQKWWLCWGTVLHIEVTNC